MVNTKFMFNTLLNGLTVW